MKTLTSILLILLSFALAYANDYENPAQFCVNEPCTEKMLSIAQDYTKGADLFSSRDLSAYSGECFHLNPDYDADHAHHGAFAFEKKQNQLFSGGIFSFFSQNDPYEQMTTSELQSWLHKASSFSPVVIADNQVRLDYLSNTSSIQYWFRSSADQKNLYVIGRNSDFNYVSLVFCQMSAR